MINDNSAVCEFLSQKQDHFSCLILVDHFLYEPEWEYNIEKEHREKREKQE